MNYGNMFLMYNLFLRFMDDRNVLLVNVLFLYHWLQVLMNDILMMFMEDILMFLLYDILVVLYNYIFVFLSNHWSLHVFLNYGTLLMSY